MDTTKLSDIVTANFGGGRNLVGKGKMFVKDKAKDRLYGHFTHCTNDRTS